MKRVLWISVLLCFLAGCNNENLDMDRCIALRERLLVTGCAFRCVVTADFGENLYSFTMDCTTDAQGTLSFSVVSPEEISEISGTVRAGKGKLEYADAILAFPLLADGEISPVSVPWLLINSLRSGYLASCGKDGEFLLLTVHDSFAEDALQLDVWLDKNQLPLKAEILWHGRRAVSIAVEEFHFV